MFCDSCGTPLVSTAQFCGSCGKPVRPGIATQTPYPHPQPQLVMGRVQRHINPLATFWLVNGILRLLEVGWLVIWGHRFFPSMRGFAGPGPGWPFVHVWPFDSLLSAGLFAGGVFLGFFGIVHLILAWGLFERSSWARPLGIVVGFLALLRIPFGTALGIYTLWVLLPANSAREYEHLSRSANRLTAARASS